MYITNIAPANTLSKRAYDYKVQNLSFGYRTIPSKPIIENESGRIIFEKLLKWVKNVSNNGVMDQPVFKTIGDRSYGIFIDSKTIPSAIKAEIKNIPQGMSKEEILKNWNKINNSKDVFSGEFDSETGKMLIGDFNGIHFKRISNKRTRRMHVNRVSFSPVGYSSNNWGAMINSTELNKDPLGSIFLAMTKSNASILPKKV